MGSTFQNDSCHDNKCSFLIIFCKLIKRFSTFLLDKVVSLLNIKFGHKHPK